MILIMDHKFSKAYQEKAASDLRNEFMKKIEGSVSKGSTGMNPRNKAVAEDDRKAYGGGGYGR